MSFSYYYHFFFLHREAFDGQQSGPAGLVCWGTRESPPRPQPRSLPRGDPRESSSRGIFCSLWPESPSKGMQGTHPLCSVAWACAAVALHFPPRGSHPAWKRGRMRPWGQGMKGWDAPRQTRAAVAARRGRTGLYWGWGAQCCGMYPVSHRHIFIYIRRTLGVPVCVYTGCVCVYIFICCIYKDIHIHRFVLIT